MLGPANFYRSCYSTYLVITVEGHISTTGQRDPERKPPASKAKILFSESRHLVRERPCKYPFPYPGFRRPSRLLIPPCWYPGDEIRGPALLRYNHKTRPPRRAARGSALCL